MEFPRPASLSLAALVTAALAVPVAFASPAAADPAPGYQVSATIPVGLGPIPVAVDPLTSTVYVGNSTSGMVSVVDGATNTVTTNIATGSQQYGLDVDPSTSTVYSTSMTARSVSVIDGVTNTVTTTLTPGVSPAGLAVDPLAHTVYTANSGDGTVTVIDGANHAVTTTLSLGVATNRVAVDPTTRRVYVSDQFSEGLYVVDGATNEVVDSLHSCARPIGVAVDASTHAVYVACQFNNAVAVFDGTTLELTGWISVGSRPSAVAVDPTTHAVYATNSTGNTVSVIDGTSKSVVATVPVGSSPQGVAVDPITHIAYVTNSSSNTISVISPPTAAPTVAGLSPAAGSDDGGTSVTITGTDFTGATGVSFGGTAATSFTVDSPTQVTAVAPAGAGTVDVSVTTPGGTSATGPATRFAYVASLALSPNPAGGIVGKPKAFTAEGFDAQGNSLGDVTVQTNFLTNGGYCAGAECTATGVGSFEVIGSLGSAIGSVPFTVRPAEFDHIVLTPSTRTLMAGASQTYRVTAYDAYDNLRATVTGQATLTTADGASCNGATCTSTTPGTYTVTASYGGKTATATLKVVPGAVDRFELTPTTRTIVSGGSQTYRLVTYDAYGNSRTVPGAPAGLTMDGGDCADGVCASTTPGQHTVTAYHVGLTVTAMLRVRVAVGQTSLPRG